jgi:hypothetical protein
MRESVSEEFLINRAAMGRRRHHRERRHGAGQIERDQWAVAQCRQRIYRRRSMTIRRFMPGAWLVAAAGMAVHAAPAPASASASTPAARRTAVECPARPASASQDPARRTSKLRHALSAEDSCGGSFGLGQPVEVLPPTRKAGEN